MKIIYSLSQRILRSLLFVMLPFFSAGQDTFSICAVDPVTGQVGSAGATCISSSSTSAIIISDVHPGVGVVHTQASWLAANQNLARTYMNQGTTPLQIIDSITLHDVQNNPSIRQYGVVSLDSGGLSAGYTGINCSNYKNHITGPTYSIQGNILLGQQILDSMQAGFLNTSGSLACKLMAALQGARVVGADTRCALNGISSFSAFIRVANPGDSTGNMYLDITVNTYPAHKEPIDTLQVLFDLWGGCSASYITSAIKKTGIKIYPNPVSDIMTVETTGEINLIKILNMQGVILKEIAGHFSGNSKIDLRSLSNGIYIVMIQTREGDLAKMKFVKE